MEDKVVQRNNYQEGREFHRKDQDVVRATKNQFLSQRYQDFSKKQNKETQHQAKKVLTDKKHLTK